MDGKEFTLMTEEDQFCYVITRGFVMILLVSMFQATYVSEYKIILPGVTHFYTNGILLFFFTVHHHDGRVPYWEW